MSAELETVTPSDPVPFARFLGVQAAGEDGIARLPFVPHLIGNPMLPALHGGVIGAFMEIAAFGELRRRNPSAASPKLINVSIQYLRSGKPIDTFARATIRRVGRTVANIEVVAWQDDPDQAIATLQAHFLVA